MYVMRLWSLARFESPLGVTIAEICWGGSPHPLPTVEISGKDFWGVLFFFRSQHNLFGDLLSTQFPQDGKMGIVSPEGDASPSTLTSNIFTLTPGPPVPHFWKCVYPISPYWGNGGRWHRGGIIHPHARFQFTIFAYPTFPPARGTWGSWFPLGDRGKAPVLLSLKLFQFLIE
jgi:hypothetical protein